MFVAYVVDRRRVLEPRTHGNIEVHERRTEWQSFIGSSWKPESCSESVWLVPGTYYEDD